MENTLKSLIKKVIREEISKIKLKEADESDWEIPKKGHPESYIISYYATVGEHGEAGKFRDFKSAYTAAISKIKGKNSEGESFLDGLEYVGVEATWETDKDFAIIFVQASYIKHINSDQNFKAPEDRKIFIDAAKKCLQTGKPVVGKFT